MNWIQRLLGRLGAPAGASVSADIATVDGVVDSIETKVDDLDGDVVAVKGVVDSVETKVDDLDGDVVAVKGVVDSVETKVGTNVDAAGTTTLFARLKQIVDTYLADGTIGLAQIESLVDDLETAVGAIEGATSLHNKLTVARAGNLDQLDFDLQGTLATIAGYIDAEVAALLADVGDASEATLGSILGILGDPAQSFLAMTGYEGATSLADKLTAVRAALLDQITAVRMQELDAANLPSDIDALLTRLGTPAAGTVAGDVESVETKVDDLDGDVVAVKGVVDSVETKVDDLDGDVAVVKALVDTAESAGPFSYLDAGGEQDVLVDAAVTRRHIWLDFSNRNMTQTGTFRIYRKVDGTNYDLYANQPVTVGAGDERAWDAEFTVNQGWKLTYEEDVNEGAAREIPYNVITQVIE